VQIRDATAADAAAIAALWTEAYTGVGPGERPDPYRVEEAEATLAAAPVFLAEEDGAIVGVVALYPPGAEVRVVGGEGEAELSRLAVARRARRRGVAWALTLHCIDTALEAEYEAIVLWSRSHQTAAHQLYEKLDFVRQPGRDSSDARGPRRVYRIDLRIAR
jgi:ribosomal protein S18 acetylase RimI-like enzyme